METNVLKVYKFIFDLPPVWGPTDRVSSVNVLAYSEESARKMLKDEDLLDEKIAEVIIMEPGIINIEYQNH